LFEILYTYQDDSHFSQWLNCFEILFDYSSKDIYREYLELRKGILYDPEAERENFKPKHDIWHV